MVKTAFKNFAKYILYIFVIMGMIYLAMLLCVFVLFNGVLMPIRDVSVAVFEEVVSYIYNFFGSMRLTALFNADFLRNFLSGLAEKIDTLDRRLLRTVIARVAGAIVLVIAANKLSQFFCRRMMRKQISSEESLRGFLLLCFRSMITVAFWAGYLIISYLWFFAIFLLPFVSLVLGSLQDLFSTWFIHFRKYKISEILNYKTVLRHIGAGLLMKSVVLVACALAGLFNIILALLLALPLLSYTTAVLDITSASFFRNKHTKEGLLLRPANHSSVGPPKGGGSNA